MNIRTFVAILSRNPQYDFPKMKGGGGQRPFGTFPKIHPFWRRRLSLRLASTRINFKDSKLSKILNAEGFQMFRDLLKTSAG